MWHGAVGQLLEIMIWKVCRREKLCPNLRYSLAIFVDRLRKTTTGIIPIKVTKTITNSPQFNFRPMLLLNTPEISMSVSANEFM
jgi:hypothetical protein